MIMPIDLTMSINLVDLIQAENLPMLKSFSLRKITRLLT
jgi:hypothetical protein